MSYLIAVFKVIAIFAVLIALRLIIQARMNNTKGGELLKNMLPFFVPPLITGGPILIAIPALLSAGANPSSGSYLAIFGAAGLSIGLVAMLGMLTRQGNEIRRLERLIGGDDGKKPLPSPPNRE